jgi:hypothetical protein
VFLPHRRKETVTNLAFTAYKLTENFVTAFLGMVYEAIMYKYTDIRLCMTYATGCEGKMHGGINKMTDQIN